MASFAQTLALCVVLMLLTSSAAFSPSAAAQPLALRRTAVTCRLQAGEGSVSRRGLLQGALGVALAPAAAFAQDAAAPKKPEEKKKTPEEKRAEKKRLEEESQANAEAFDASLGLFGCAFWGLEKKPNSGACQPKAK